VVLANDGEAFVILAGVTGSNTCKIVTRSNDVTIVLEKGARIDWDTEAEPVLAAFDVLEGKKVVRIWNSLTDEWSAFGRERGERIEVGGEIREKWNGVELERVRGSIAKREAMLQAREFRKKARAISLKLAKAAPMGPTAEEILDVDYVFLAARRQVTDRALIAGLMDKDSTWSQTPWSVFYRFNWAQPALFVFGEVNYQRVRADHFLAIWENKIPVGPLQSRRFWARKHYLGVVLGSVKLPTPITQNPGTMCVYLVPASERGRNWVDAPGVETLKIKMPAVSDQQGDLTDKIEFVFGTIPAGEYFAKAIWDRRRPTTDGRRAGPGDYESDFVGPLKMEAGVVMTNVVLECTNRVGEAEGYYAADETVRKRWKAGELRTEDFLKDFSRPVREWIVETNLAYRGDFPIKRISARSFGAAKVLRLFVNGFKDRRRETLDPPFDLLAVSVGVARTGRTNIIHELNDAAFGVSFTVPGETTSFRLVGYRRKVALGNVVFDYTVTNLLGAVSNSAGPSDSGKPPSRSE
jgi:hypothetical protein